MQKEQHIAKRSKKSDGMILAAAVRARNTNIAAEKPLDKEERSSKLDQSLIVHVALVKSCSAASARLPDFVEPMKAQLVDSIRPGDRRSQLALPVSFWRCPSVVISV